MAVAKLEPAKTETHKETTTMTATDAILAIADVAFAFSEEKRPSLAECARVASRASYLLKLGEEREAAETSAGFAIAKKYGLVG
jgi:hypothetical protein